MRRREFIVSSSVLTAGLALAGPLKAAAANGDDLYRLFQNPPMPYKPFVRWWWNGDKIEKAELARELRLLKDNGIGGVEINPIRFPARTEDMGKASLPWLSKEWIEMLDFTLTEAKKLDMTCDMIVGSGWPFGGPWLEGDERSQLMTIAAIGLQGPLDYEISVFELLKEADPQLASPFAGRTPELVSVQLVPTPMDSLAQVIPVPVTGGTIRCNVPEGSHVLYALVKITGFMQVIYGAPGAGGPVLNHYNGAAVRKYLHRMSATIQAQIGSLSGRLRAFFCDSLELEGANWCSDMAEEFQTRRGYDLMPWLPYSLFKTYYMGDTIDGPYGADLTPGFLEQVKKVRYDFELTKAELFRERFIDQFTAWCKANGVQSRMQAYGRGYLPLEGSMAPDIPEGETWLKYGSGKVMDDSDYSKGRAYTVVNKFVSSAAHLRGKRQISCEELTNTEMVFFESLEIMKIAGDQSTLSGVTHPIFHGFNYSPPDAPFPGWIRYGCYINEHNTWWPYFRLFTAYKARLSAILQQGDMFADIAILPATADLWRNYSSQNDPFPQTVYPSYLPILWEAIHQNGNGCDYTSENVIQRSVIKEGYLHFGPRKYHTLFLVAVEHLEPATLQKLQDFVSAGGKVFDIEKGNGFKLLTPPEYDFTGWFRNIQNKYGLTPYVKLDKPHKFISQVRYQAGGTDLLFIANSNDNESYSIILQPEPAICRGHQAWLWDAETGERQLLESAESILLDLGPAESKLIVFEKTHEKYRPVRSAPPQTPVLVAAWALEGQHINGKLLHLQLTELKDVKEIAGWANFCGTLVYTATIQLTAGYQLLDLGKVAGISELKVNGKVAGAKWYGRRKYEVGKLLVAGENHLEVKVITIMGNYMKSLKDNAIAQYWTNSEQKNQPLQAIGLLGPVTLS